MSAPYDSWIPGANIALDPPDAPALSPYDDYSEDDSDQSEDPAGKAAHDHHRPGYKTRGQMDAPRFMEQPRLLVRKPAAPVSTRALPTPTRLPLTQLTPATRTRDRGMITSR